MRLLPLSMFVALASACIVAPVPLPDLLDVDGDGFLDDVDCDDADALAFPGGDEVCDGVDNDCNGLIDDGAPEAVPYFADDDLDGFGGASLGVLCNQPDGSVTNDQDCDDFDESAAPDLEESCDLIDNDCDGVIDEDDAYDAFDWWLDADGDIYGDPDTPLGRACYEPVAGAVVAPGDCDDSDAAVHPDSPEICNDVDDDCDGTIDVAATDGVVYYADVDGDGHGDPNESLVSCSVPPGYVGVDTDCDDSDPTRNPNTVWRIDADGDGFGSDADTGTVQCTRPSPDYVVLPGDCDDTDAAVNPTTDWWVDLDGDGYGRDDAGPGQEDVCEQPGGFTPRVGDCDDTDPDLNPETIWGEDNDGDGFGNETGETWAQCEHPFPGLDDYAPNAIDCDDTDASVHPDTIWYPDFDADGLGLSGAAIAACVQPPSHVDVAGDCDDTRPGPECTDPITEVNYATFVGTSGSRFGTSVSFAPDGDGGGFVDLLFGAPGEQSGRGAAYIDQRVQGPGIYDANVLSARREAPDASDLVGTAVAGGGDVDGDGVAEVLIGSPGSSVGGLESGAVWMLWGAAVDGDETLVEGAAAFRFEGVAAGEHSGTSVVFAEADVVVGVPDADPDGEADAGVMHLFDSGTINSLRGDARLDNDDARLTLTGVEAGARLGSTLAVVDLFGDGVDDLMIGAPLWGSQTGIVWVTTSGGSGTFPLDIGLSGYIHGEAGSQAGTAISRAGDVNGDGLDDMWVGAPGANGAVGAVYLVHGSSIFFPSAVMNSSADAQIDGPSGQVGFGATLAGGHDLTGDGEPDVVVGSPVHAEGRVYVLYGPFDGRREVVPGTDRSVEGLTTGDQFGASISLGDVDGDNKADLLIGAPEEGGGTAYLVLGADL